MLAQLYIENIAVIQKASIELTSGLNVFTGETGAGKTILINAINAVLGGRTYKDIIRSGENKAVVSAVFSNIPADICNSIAELGYETDEGQLMVSRELYSDGKSSSRINGRPATVTVLRQVSQMLIDIHGQNDSRELMDSQRHLCFIDNFGELMEQLENYRQSYGRLCEVREKLKATQMDESYKLQRQDILQYQIDEIAEADLTDGEEEDLTSQRDMIRNSEKIVAALGAIHQVLGGDDDTAGMLDEISALQDELATAGRYIDELEGYSAKVSDFRYEMQELFSSVSSYLDDSGFDPRQLDGIETRLETISRLKKKYGGSIGEVLTYYDRIIEEMDSLIFSDKEVEKLTVEETRLREETQRLANELTTARREAGERFVSLVQQELAYLDMPNVRLAVRSETKELSPNGQDVVELLISANPGEPPRPLSRIASGGELSRMMLAIKNVLADKDDIGTIIFDEVDAGVSGRAAYKIGRKLHEVSDSRQILCVTHLAQVAAFGDHHLKIYKTVEGERTYTHVGVLDRRQRIEELARITVGENLTPAALQSATEMLEQTGH